MRQDVAGHSTPGDRPKGPATHRTPGASPRARPDPADCTHAAPGRRPRPGARRLGPRAPPPRRRRDRLPARLQGLPHARRDGRRRSRRSPPPTRRSCARSRSARAHQGRELLAAKVSDNVATDEAEPEAYIDGLTHGNEPMSLEMTIRILRWLAEGYGSDSRITGHRGPRPRSGSCSPSTPTARRTTTAPARSATGARTASRTPGTTAIGTDLNRNYGYRWGGSGLEHQPVVVEVPRRRPRSRRPRRAPSATSSAAGSSAAGSRSGWRSRSTSSGGYVMWPYAATTANLPSDMTSQDRAALVTIGKAHGVPERLPSRCRRATCTSRRARPRTGCTARTGSFAYTVELSAVDYPKDTAIASETGRNKDAVLYLLERAWCPLAVVSAAVRDARCGAFDDDLEVARGWTREPGRDGHGPGVRRAGRAATRRGRACRGVTLQPTTTPSGRRGVRDRAGSPATAPPRTTSTAGRRSDRRRSSCRARPGSGCSSAGSSGTRRARPPRTTCARSSRDRTAAQTVVWERTGSPSVVGGRLGIRLGVAGPVGRPGDPDPVRGGGCGRRIDDRRGRRRRQGHAPAGAERGADRSRPRASPRCSASLSAISSSTTTLREIEIGEPLGLVAQPVAADRARRCLLLALDGDQPLGVLDDRVGGRVQVVPEVAHARRAASTVPERTQLPSRYTYQASNVLVGQAAGADHDARVARLEQALQARRARDARCEQRLGDGAEGGVVGRVADELDRPLARSGRSVARCEQPGEPSGVSMLLHVGRAPACVSGLVRLEPTGRHARQRRRRRPACSRPTNARSRTMRRCPATRARAHGPGSSGRARSGIMHG